MSAVMGPCGAGSPSREGVDVPASRSSADTRGGTESLILFACWHAGHRPGHSRRLSALDSSAYVDISGPAIAALGNAITRVGLGGIVEVTWDFAVVVPGRCPDWNRSLHELVLVRLVLHGRRHVSADGGVWPRGVRSGWTRPGR
jgi:hypothetical protein